MSIVKIECYHPKIGLKKYRFDTSKFKPHKISLFASVNGENGTFARWPSETLIARLPEIIKQIYPMYGDSQSRQRVINYLYELECRKLSPFDEELDEYSLGFDWD